LKTPSSVDATTPSIGLGVVDVAGGCGRVSENTIAYLHRKYVGKWLFHVKKEKFAKNVYVYIVKIDIF